MPNPQSQTPRPNSGPRKRADEKPELPGPLRLAYSVELEATIAISRGDSIPGPTPGLPAPIRIPHGCGGWADTFEYVKQEIERVLDMHDLPTEEVAVRINHEQASLSTEERLAAYSFFNVDDDWPIDTPKVCLASFEISTPIAPYTPRSLRVLSYAVNVLLSSFLVTVNPSCGMRVRVGQADEFTHDSLRRMSSLVWAIDPILSMLHPPWRAASPYSPSIRVYSALARGKEADELPAHTQTCRYLRGRVRHGERSRSRQEKHPEAVDQPVRSRAPKHFEPFDGHGTDGRNGPLADKADYDFGSNRPPRPPPPDSSTSSASGVGLDPREFPESQAQIAKRVASLPRRRKARVRERLVSMPRLLLAKHSNSRLRAWAGRSLPAVTGDWFRASVTDGDLGVFPAVQRIYQAETSCEIAALLGEDTTRMNYNLRPCTCVQFLRPGAPRMVEFRGAEGSLDPEWICAWAKICVGILRFAMNSPVQAFLEVLRSCEEAASGAAPAPYDIIDLLCDVGLLTEAQIAAKRLQENAGQWELEFQKTGGNQEEVAGLT